jgi:4-amino-4-deoxy-L-arabinose transferase-like glycosyltransferase
VGRPVVFLLSWAAWVFLLFSLSHSKLPTYFLPAIAPLSVLMGLVWQEVGKQAPSRPPDWLTAGFALLLAIGVLAAAASHSWLFDSLHVRLAKKLAPSVLELIQPSLLYTGLILAALGFLGRRLATKVRGQTLAITTFVLLLAVVPMFVLRWYAPLKLLTEAHSSRGLAATILASPERDSPIYGYYYFRTSLPFYLRRPVGLLSVKWGETTSNYQVAHQEAARQAAGRDPGKGILVTLPEFLALKKSNTQPILVMAPNALVENLWVTAGRIDPLWNEADFSVWEIPPANAARQDNVPAKVVAPFQP